MTGPAKPPLFAQPRLDATAAASDPGVTGLAMGSRKHRIVGGSSVPRKMASLATCFTSFLCGHSRRIDPV